MHYMTRPIGLFLKQLAEVERHELLEEQENVSTLVSLVPTGGAVISSP
jgi:hypothetical protein